METSAEITAHAVAGWCRFTGVDPAFVDPAFVGPAASESGGEAGKPLRLAHDLGSVGYRRGA